MFTFDNPREFCEKCLPHVGRKIAAALAEISDKMWEHETFVEQEVGQFTVKVTTLNVSGGGIQYVFWIEGQGYTWARARCVCGAGGQTRCAWIEVFASDNENAAVYLAL